MANVMELADMSSRDCLVTYKTRFMRVNFHKEPAMDKAECISGKAALMRASGETAKRQAKVNRLGLMATCIMETGKKAR